MTLNCDSKKKEKEKVNVRENRFRKFFIKWHANVTLYLCFQALLCFAKQQIISHRLLQCYVITG